MRPAGRRTTETKPLQSPEDFAALQEEWDELYRHAPLATPFQSWAWLYSWWEHYGKGRELCLVTQRSGEGLLVGILPFALERRMGLGRLAFIGTGITEYQDIIAREGWEEEVVEAGQQFLAQTGYRYVADLHQLRPKALVWRVVRGWEGLSANLRQDSCPVIEVRPWDELLATLSRNLRSTVRRTIRRAERDGLLCEPARAGEEGPAARRFIDLHREMWSDRDIAPEHLSPRFESHLVAAARRMSASGSGEIREFQRDGKVEASHFVLLGRDSVGHYLSGASREALESYQVSSLFIRDGIDLAHRQGKAYFDLLGGEEGYKLRWKPRLIRNRRVILARNPLLWAAYAGYHLARHRAREYASAQDAPRWAREARSAYRSLRTRLR